MFADTRNDQYTPVTSRAFMGDNSQLYESVHQSLRTTYNRRHRDRRDRPRKGRHERQDSIDERRERFGERALMRHDKMDTIPNR